VTIVADAHMGKGECAGVAGIARFWVCIDALPFPKSDIPNRSFVSGRNVVREAP
jgi:hypothetical protein